jgi:PEP-CTERM motif
MSAMTKAGPIGFGILVAALLGGILSTPARAQLSVNNYHGLALPSADEEIIGYFNPVNLPNPGVESFSNSDGSGTATGSTGSQTANPTVSATVSCCKTENPQSISWGASSNLLWAFEVTGTASATAIVDINADGGVSGIYKEGMTGQAEALLSLIDVTALSNFRGNAPAPLLTETVEGCATPCSYSTPAYSFTLDDVQLTVRVGDVILVQQEAADGVVGIGNFSATFSAYVDPQILLDPSDPPGLNLVFSPGIEQPSRAPGPSVPEPSTVSLLGIGAVLVACRLIRKRPQPSTEFSVWPT